MLGIKTIPPSAASSFRIDSEQVVLHAHLAFIKNSE